MKARNEGHIVYIITKLELGGAQKVCLALHEGFAGQGKASLISGQDGALVDQAQRFEGVYLLKSLKREVALRGMWNEIKAFFEIISILKLLKKRYGKLIVHTHSTKAGIVGRWASIFVRGTRRIHTVHGFGFNSYQSRPRWVAAYFFELLSSLITHRYVCVSSHDISQGNALLPFFKKKQVLIRAAVPSRLFFRPAVTKRESKESIFPKNFVFGTVSCFKPQKNLLDLFKAFQLLSVRLREVGCESAMSLEVIGDGLMRPELEAFIKEHGLSDRIKLLGWQAHVAPIMHTWNCFVMSSLWEGLPCALVEARLARLPVVAYKVGGIGDLIVDQKNGFLVKPKEWIMLERRMERLVLDRECYKKMSSYQENLSDFDTFSMIEKHKQLYAELF